MRATRVRSVKAIVQRAQCLDLILDRLLAEEWFETNAASPEKIHSYLHRKAAAGAGALPEHLSSREAPVWNAPLGKVPPEDRRALSWARENVGVLALALGLCELPAYDHQVFEESLAIIKTLESKQKPKLRPVEELVRGRDRAEVWFWRALVATGKHPSTPISAVVQRIAARDPQFAVRDGDLGLFGKPYCRLSDDERSEAFSIAYERYYTFIWLLGDRYRGGRREWDENERTFVESPTPYLSFPA